MKELRYTPNGKSNTAKALTPRPLAAGGEGRFRGAS